MARGCAVDLTGDRFGWLTVIEKVERQPGDRGPAKWLCECRCGNTAIKRADKLRYGQTTTCGCRGDYNARVAAEAKKRHGEELAYTGGWVRGRFGVMYPAVSRNEEALA